MLIKVAFGVTISAASQRICDAVADNKFCKAMCYNAKYRHRDVACALSA